jgi:hypothetical protein
LEIKCSAVLKLQKVLGDSGFTSNILIIKVLYGVNVHDTGEEVRPGFVAYIEVSREREELDADALNFTLAG